MSGEREKLAAVLAQAFSFDKSPADIADALLPVVRELQAEERARAVQPFRELFAGGPDTVCRTTWRHGPHADPALLGTAIECVEVPMDDLRAAFDAVAEEAALPSDHAG